MIGSEGTLGFVSRATYNTVPEWAHKARLSRSPARAGARAGAEARRGRAARAGPDGAAARPGRPRLRRGRCLRAARAHLFDGALVAPP
jgi:FAD/FMN-containing dehydrogenase